MLGDPKHIPAFYNGVLPGVGLGGNKSQNLY